MKHVFLLFFLMLAGMAAMAQTRTLTGFIRDSATNNPVQYATVKVRGKNIVATTGTDGGFSIGLPTANVTLDVSYVGYATQSIAVDDNDNNIIVLLGQSKTGNLNEVVVTALGITKDSRKLGYAVSTVNGDQFNKARETNVALSLSGQVAGLDVHGTNGGPGGTARILLRGMSSMNSGGSPLFVVNGVPIDNSNRGSAGEWGGADAGDGIGNINPDDIETMTVLKGQAASALYGARASNGVILITTKTGKKGTATVTYNTNYQVDQAINNTDFQYQYGQGQNGNKPVNSVEARTTARLSWGSKLDGSTFTQFDGKQYSYSPYKDNIKNFYRYGPTFTNTVAVSGGGDNGTYRISLSNLDNQSIVRNSGITRRTINVNIDQKVTSKLDVSILANYIDEQDKNREQLSDGPGNPNNGFFLASNINENILKPGYDSTGREIVFSDDNYVTNPWFVVNKWVNNTGRKRLISSVSTRYNFTDWLYVLGRMGYDIENDRYLSVEPTGTDYTVTSSNQSGSIHISTPQISELNLDGILGVSHKIVKDLDFSATLGANARRNRYEAIGIGGHPFVIPNLYTPGNVLTPDRSYGYSLREVHSAYYSVDFTYKNFLTVNTTGRYDAYSTLPSTSRSIFTPSVSGGFIFSNFLHSNTLNYGKLRAAYAQTSGEPGGGPPDYGAYGTSVYYYVNNAINGISSGGFSSNLPNLFLKPFTLTEYEFGTELKFLNNRLGLDVTYFYKKSHDEIFGAGLSSATGYSSTFVANGSTLNKGLEVQVTGTPVRSRSFNWNITFNATSIANKILKTDESNNIIGLGTYRPLNANTAFIVGLAGPQILAHDYTYDSKGQIEVDASGLPIAGKLIPMGGVLPTFYGGLRNDFSFGNFNLSFLINYNYGNKILSATQDYSVYRGLNKMTLVGREGGITTGVTAGGTANTVAADAESYYQRLSSMISRNSVLNGDYIKLRQVTLGYTLGGKLFAHVPIFSSVDLSLVGRNLLTLMKKSDNIDPESGFNASINYAGIEGTSLPSTRTFGINANFKFKK